jgi:hypothetical protein
MLASEPYFHSSAMPKLGKLVRGVPINGKWSPSTYPSRPMSTDRFSWSSKGTYCSIRKKDSVDTVVPSTPLEDDEYERIQKARERLALRDIELRQIVRHCNGEMDVVRRRLVKDLEILEILKEEIEKAGDGPLREQLEMDFHHGTYSLFRVLD